MSSTQLPLRLRFADSQRLEDFLPADAAAVRAVRAWLDGSDRQELYLAGPPGSGKSHLLLAAAARVDADAVAYLPLRALGPAAAEALNAQPTQAWLLVDELEAIAGDAAAEFALFTLYNRHFDAGARMLFGARGFADALGLGLPDLQSRLSRGLRFALTPLDDAQRRAWLAQRAADRGFKLDEAAIDWLLRRVGRDLPGLGAVLDRLDRASLAEQRRVTVPFLRRVLAQTAAKNGG